MRTPVAAPPRRAPLAVVPAQSVGTDIDDLPAVDLGGTRGPRRRRDEAAAGWSRALVLGVLGVDLGAALVSSLGAVLLRWGTDGPARYLLLSLALPLAWVVVLASVRLYESRYLGVGTEEFRRLGKAGVLLTAGCGFLAYVTAEPVARGYVLVALPLTILLDALGRYALRRVLQAQRAKGRCLSTVILVGHADEVARFADELGRDSTHGLRVIGACLVGPAAGAATVNGVPVLGGLGDVERVLRDSQADTVAVLSSPETSGRVLRKIAWSIEGSHTELVVAPGLMEVAGPRLTIRPVAGLPLLHLERPELTGGRRWLKEGFDRSVALVALLLLLPLFAIVGLVIRSDRCGGGIYRQTRVGVNGRPFTLLKFRTMCAGADGMVQNVLALNDQPDGPLFKIRDDPRVTRVGRVLRRYSIDELPQLVNVLRGEMSLVGPRPPLPGEVQSYATDVHRRLLVKPGLTGLWQVSGRSDLTWEESVRLDLRYVDNWSLALDALILGKTLRAVVRGSGAY